MNTITHKQVEATSPIRKQSSTGRRFARSLLYGLLRILGGLFVALSMLPVALLPFVTSVPFLLFLLLAAVDGGLLAAAFRTGGAPLARLAILAAIGATGVVAVLLSQAYASTPAIVDADGRPLPGSIAELTAVELNGRQQWVTIRGHDVNKPVLLFLSGGPGGSQLAATRRNLAALEEHFVVVNWDQPGAGKSYGAADFAELTPEQYVADGHALTEYLRQRFDQEKIYILGESWGNILGVWLVQGHPQHYHALVGVAQMVAFLETDLYDYELALQIAEERGDTGKVDALRKQGPPPYYGKGVAMKVVEYIMYLSSYMNGNPEIHTNYNTFGDIAAPEYGLYDKVNYVRGLLQTMNVLWPQLWDVDFRQQATRLEAPVYFLEGRHDVNAPPALVKDYLDVLDAPHKELIWFEHSGHSPWVEEPAKVVDVMVNTVLKQTAP